MASTPSLKKNHALYDNIEAVLKTATTPLTPAMIYEEPTVRAHATRPGQINDALGAFLQKKAVRKAPYTGGVGRSKVAYTWRTGEDLAEAPEATPAKTARKSATSGKRGAAKQSTGPTKQQIAAALAKNAASLQSPSAAPSVAVAVPAKPAAVLVAQGGASEAQQAAPVNLSMKVSRDGKQISFALAGLLLSIEVTD